MTERAKQKETTLKLSQGEERPGGGPWACGGHGAGGGHPVSELSPAASSRAPDLKDHVGSHGPTQLHLLEGGPGQAGSQAFSCRTVWCDHLVVVTHGPCSKGGGAVTCCGYREEVEDI